MLEGVEVSRKNMYFVFLQSTMPRSRLNTSARSVIGAMPIYTPCESTKPHTEGATRTGARFVVKVSSRLQICVVTWCSIQESLSSIVTFAAASFVICRISKNIWSNIRKNHPETDR